MQSRIPMEQSPSKNFQTGIKGIEDLMNKIREAGLTQQQLNQTKRYQDAQVDLSRQSGGRAEQARQEAHQAHLLKTDPQAQMQYIMALRHAMQNGAPGQSLDQVMGGGGMPPQQPGMPGMQPGMGEQQQPPMQQQMGEQQQPMQESPQQPQQPVNSMRDMASQIPREAWPMLKQATGIDLAAAMAETPQEKRQSALQDKITLEENKARVAEEKLQQKYLQKVKEEIPAHTRKLREVMELQKLMDKHKEWFSPGYLGVDALKGPSWRKHFSHDKDYGRIETLLGALIGPQSQEFSSKGLASALALAKEIKPNMSENYEIASGKVDQILDRLKSSLAEDIALTHDEHAPSQEDPLGIFGGGK